MKNVGKSWGKAHFREEIVFVPGEALMLIINGTINVNAGGLAGASGPVSLQFIPCVVGLPVPCSGLET